MSEPLGVEPYVVGGAAAALDSLRHGRKRRRHYPRIGDLTARGYGRSRHDGNRAVGLSDIEILRCGRHQKVASQIQVALAVTQSGSCLQSPVADAQVGHYGSALLRDTGLVKFTNVASLEVSGHRDDLRDGKHTGAADSSEAHREEVARKVLWRLHETGEV